MTRTSFLTTHKHDRVLWLRIALSDRFDECPLERWRHRLQAFISQHGLNAAISRESILIVTRGRPITPFDRAVVMGWLIAQPEVVFVHIERMPSTQSRIKRHLALKAPRPTPVDSVLESK